MSGPGSPVSILEDSYHSEEGCVIQAILAVLSPQMENAEDGVKFRNILRDVFPNSARPASGTGRHSSTLINGIKDQLHEDNLQDTNDLIEKVSSWQDHLYQSQNTKMHTQSNLYIILLLNNQTLNKVILVF